MPVVATLVAMLGAPACYSPVDSQSYFVEATAADRALEPVYSTSLYTVFFDYALMRCIIHSSHTWGQQGGGGGGTGIGIVAFRCDPAKIRAQATRLGLEVYPPRMRIKQRPAAAPKPEPGPAPAAPTTARTPTPLSGEGTP
jgi:hypothetical protein